MRIILSRKGFDSSAGACASPILPGGLIQSLPIPSDGAPISFLDIHCEHAPLGSLVEALTRGRVSRSHPAHLDPDLQPAARSRLPGWRPAFGQIDKAQRHLAENGVGVGDLFVFFGWFREISGKDGDWAFTRGAPDLHVMFGWLQVGEVVDAGSGAAAVLSTYPWLAGHPHLSSKAAPNVIYLAAQRLSLPGSETSHLPGSGTFSVLHPDLVLTRSEQHLRSVWHLPSWFYPAEGRPPLTYHREKWRWGRDESGAVLQSVGRGQEFVLDCAHYPEALGWAEDLIRTHGGRV